MLKPLSIGIRDEVATHLASYLQRFACEGEHAFLTYLLTAFTPADG